MTFFSLSLRSQIYQMKAKSIVRFFGKTLWAALLVNMFLASGTTTAIAHEQHPNILLNAQEISAIKAKISIVEKMEWSRLRAKNPGKVRQKK